MNYQINSPYSENSRLTEVASIVLVSIRRQIYRKIEIEKNSHKKSLDFTSRQSVNAPAIKYFGE